MDSLASAMISGKVNQVTKELGDAVGLNDDSGNNEVSTSVWNEGIHVVSCSSQEALRHAQAKEDSKRAKEIEKRGKEREARKKERQTERDKIREKYQLSDTTKAKSSSSSSRQQDSDSKCVIS